MTENWTKLQIGIRPEVGGSKEGNAPIRGTVGLMNNGKSKRGKQNGEVGVLASFLFSRRTVFGSRGKKRQRRQSSSKC